MRPVLLLVVVAAAAIVVSPRAARADGAVLALPAPAVTQWQIIAGYNTATHTSTDPHAIDIVRIDGATAGTAVLAPISGSLTWRSSDCVLVRDAFGMEHLLCHLFPSAGLNVGDVIQRGQPLGAVAPDGAANNNGIAHIHYAVHQSLGGGSLGMTVPFSGAYALEGVALPAVSTPNAYAGTRLTSSNGVAGDIAPAAPPADAGEDDPLPPTTTTTPDQSANANFLYPGWNLVGWTENTPITTATAAIHDRFESVFTFDGPGQRFLRYAPGLPDGGNTLGILRFGDGVWLRITDPSGAVLPRFPEVTERTVLLTGGFNLVTWTGSSQPITDAMAALDDTLLAVFAFDARTQQFASYRPQGPAFTNTLGWLVPGQAVWIQVREATQLLMENRQGFPLREPAPEGETIPPPAGTSPGSTADSGATTVQARVLGPGCLNLRPLPTTIGTTPLTCLAVGTAVQLTGITAPDADGVDGTDIRVEWLFVQVQGLSGWVSGRFITQFAAGAVVTGEATFYHPSLHGGVMYCGGIYDRFNPTIAASTSWPCGTQLRVHFGGNTIDVVVQDTGLLGANHVDLSEAAFAQLAPLAEGRLAVQIEVLAGTE